MRLFGFLLVFALAAPAHAYSTESAVTEACHERMTAAALREVRARVGEQAPSIWPDTQERAFIDDLPFVVFADLQELAAISLLVGVRDNDLKGRSPTDLDELATVHGDPDGQREHCLRSEGDDEPDGTARAVADCRAYILERVGVALDGLDVTGVPDPGTRDVIAVSLETRGRVEIPLPRFWLAMGQAMHAVQDGFSHTFRSDDQLRVRSVVNWIDYVNAVHDETRDGPLHRSGLDQCVDLDAPRAARLAAAEEASALILEQALAPGMNREQKLAAVDRILASYFTVEPGCTAGDAWCDAPELAYPASRGCAIGAGGGAGWPLALLFLLPLVLRRSRALALVVLLAAAPLRAEDEVPGVATPEEKRQERKEDVRARSLVGVYVGAGASFSRPAAAASLGIRFRLSDAWSLGADAEWNPWYAVNQGEIRSGAFNAYATLIGRVPLRFARFNLRATLHAGTSTILYELYGVPKHSTGLFVGFRPLGLEVKLSSALYLIVDPLHVEVPAPQLTGVPFAYPQFRTTIGLDIVP